ncbi:MAG: dCTP deaminase [Bdellovibrionales bacterium]|nr:dCTP deaminase [Bdellovibrionales bacterium]
MNRARHFQNLNGVLSDNDIKIAIEQGDLAIEPFSPDMLRAAGITFHLGSELLIPRTGVVVDVKNQIVPTYDTVTISDQSPFQLEPGQFVLSATRERVTVGASLGFFIEGRSTLARVGLTIVQTAMLVYPGHTNRAITLELANHGPNPILLYPDMKIARAAVFRLESPASELYDTKGKYRAQDSVGPPIFANELKA